MRRALIVATAVVAGCSAAGSVGAQERPVPGPVVRVSDILPNVAGPVVEEGFVEERPALPPREILAMLDSSGFSILSPPIRRGPAYVVAVIDPDGIDGRVIVEASSGRIVRFRPIVDRGAMVVPDEVRTVFARGDLVPPRSIPNVPPQPAPRAVTRPAMRPEASLPAPRSNDRPAPTGHIATSSSLPRDKAVTAMPPAPASGETRTAVQIQPTQPMPPVQGFD